jgi:hypothetical protein
MIVLVSVSVSVCLARGTLLCRPDQVRVGDRCVDGLNRDENGDCKLGYVSDDQGVCSIRLDDNVIVKNGMNETCSTGALLKPNHSRNDCVCVENAAKADIDSCRCEEGTYQLGDVCHKMVSTRGIEKIDVDRLKKQGITHFRTICGYGTNNQIIVLQWFFEEFWTLKTLKTRVRGVRVKVFIDGSFEEELSNKYSISQVINYSLDETYGGIYTYKPWNNLDTSFVLSASFCGPDTSPSALLTFTTPSPSYTLVPTK